MYRPIIIEKAPILISDWNEIIHIKILEPSGHTTIRAYIVNYQIRNIAKGDMILIGYFLGVGGNPIKSYKDLISEQLEKGHYQRIIIHQDASKIKNVLIDDHSNRNPLEEMEGYLSKRYTHKPLQSLRGAL